MNTEMIETSLSFIDSWLRFRYERCEIPGFVVAIAHNDKLLFNKSYGYANLGKKEKLSIDHIFRVASHSKTFTAVALMQLNEKGKLRIDNHVVDYLHWLKNHKDNRFSKVTIRQLMSHSAGIIRDGLNADYWQLECAFPDYQQFKKEILKADLVFDTNVQMKYSNFGYGLLGMVVEEASGKPFNEYVEKNIIQPLGLKNTGPEYIDKIDNKLVTGYTRRDLNKSRLPLVSDIDTKSLSSAAGFYSTSEDLCKYFADLNIGSTKLLDDESKKEMQRTQWRVTNTKENEEYGLGLAIEHIGRRRMLGHGGNFPGQATNSLYDPKDKLTVVVLTNCIDADAIWMTKGIVTVIDQFQNDNLVHDTQNLGKFQGRLMNLWSIRDIVAIGKRIVAASPDTWWPFGEAEELQYVDDTTLKVVKANGYWSDGELIHFNFTKQGKINSVLYGGATMWTEAEYAKKLTMKKAGK